MSKKGLGLAHLKKRLIVDIDRVSCILNTDRHQGLSDRQLRLLQSPRGAIQELGQRFYINF